jgi:hypothetical protein
MKTINFVSEYNKIYELLQDAYSCGNLDLIAIDPKSLNSGFSELRRIKKDDLINWSKENDISLPKEFLEKKSISELEEENQNLKNKIEELQKTKSSGRDKSIDEDKIWDFVINKYFKDYKIDTNRNKTALLGEILEKINESEDIEFEIQKTSLDNIIGKFLKIISKK